MSKLALDAILNRLDVLERAVRGHVRHRLSKSQLAKAEGVSTRTISRDVGRGTRPPPDEVINGRLFWWSDTIERHRRERGTIDTTAAKAARNPRLRKPAQPEAR